MGILLGRRGVDGRPEYEVLSELHNIAKNSAEKERVKAAGGKIYRGRLAHPNLNPRKLSIACARSLGDIFFKDSDFTDGSVSGLIAEPFVRRREVLQGDSFVLLACDGFFDVVEYQEAVEFIFQMVDVSADLDDVSNALVELAQRKGSIDNIT